MDERTDEPVCFWLNFRTFQSPPKKGERKKDRAENKNEKEESKKNNVESCLNASSPAFGEVVHVND